MTSPDRIPARLWLHGRYRREGGKPCRDWAIHDGEGRLVMNARAFRVPGPIVVYAPEAEDAILLSARPRRSFPLTGRYDVFVGGDGVRCGVLTRGGRFFDAGGRKLGRFRDARRLRDNIGAGIAIAVLDAMFDASTSEASGGSRFVLLLGDRPAGVLFSGRLPFDPGTDAGPPPARESIARRLVPGKWGDALFAKRPPSGWRLAVEPDAGDRDMRIVLAAALLVIEVALW